ncbi:hypothetical protein ACTL6U_12195 [Rhodovibrionaceae bacterium A322]
MAETVLRYFQNDSRNVYHLTLLKLALEHTKQSDGPYQLVPAFTDVTHSRGLLMMENNGGIDIAIMAASTEREARFRSIRIPLMKGLLGYRISLIKSDRQADFSKVSTLENLQKSYLAGFGSQWADMAVLEANSLPVVGVPHYENLFNMLSKGRFDYFPRGISEIWKELEDRQARYPDLAIESSFALVYPYVVFFYVNKDNQALANRIERGLKKALETGEFKNLFLTHFETLLEKSDLATRRVFYLSNPNYPADIDRPDTSWWLKQDKNLTQ